MTEPRKPLLEQLTGTVGAVAGLLTALAALIIAWTQWGGDGGSAPVVDINEVNVVEPGPNPDSEKPRNKAAPAPAPSPRPAPTPTYPHRAVLENAQMGLVIIRAEPSSTSEEAGLIAPGEVVYVGDRVDGWRPVRNLAGVTGWTRSGNLTLIPE
jgi:hypothetical protein